MNVERQRNHVKALKKEWAEAIIKYGVGSFGEERRANELWREEKKLRKMEAEIGSSGQVWVVIECDGVLDEVRVVGVFETLEQASKEVDKAKKLPVARWSQLTTLERKITT